MENVLIRDSTADEVVLGGVDLVDGPEENIDVVLVVDDPDVHAMVVETVRDWDGVVAVTHEFGQQW
jgi:hypothetical protein